MSEATKERKELATPPCSGEFVVTGRMCLEHKMMPGFADRNAILLLGHIHGDVPVEWDNRIALQCRPHKAYTYWIEPRHDDSTLIRWKLNFPNAKDYRANPKT
jgi:hypothetical protein